MATAQSKNNEVALNLSPRAQEDYYWVQRAVNEKDQRAYSELLNRYRNAIFHTILKMVNNREDANDLTQEAFSKAFNKLETYAPRYAFSTWLFKIATNNCIDYIRKKRLHLLSIDDPLEPEGNQNFSNNIKASALNPEEHFMRTQKIKLIRTVLEDLPLKYRLMIELRYFEELTYDEIARELAIPLGTVKAQLFRAKEILYNKLKKSNAKAHIDFKDKRKK